MTHGISSIFSITYNINIEKSFGKKYLRSENGMLLFSVQSGTYHFKIKDFDQAKL